MANPARSANSQAKSPSRTKGGNVRRSVADADLGFWNRPALMNLVADVLYLASAIMLLSAAWVALQRLPLFPLRQLVVKAPLAHVSSAQIEQSMRTALSGNFFTVNLDAARASFETIPWVRNAELRRRWPDTIELVVDEHQAVARWMPKDGESRLVNSFGEVFTAETAAILPNFAGPEDSATRVLSRFAEFEQGVGVLDRHVVAVHLSPREAWRVRLDDGVIIDLGRDQETHTLKQRLDRFVATYPHLRQRLATAFNTIDMRYPNGFSVRTDAGMKARADS